MRSPHKMTPEMARRFLVDYRGGMSYRELAKTYNVAKGTIEHWINGARQAGFKMEHRPATVLDAFLIVKKDKAEPA